MTLQTLKWELGLYFRDRCAHYYSDLTRRAHRTFQDMTTSVRNVGPSANSALIRYSSLRLWLSRMTRDSEWTNG